MGFLEVFGRLIRGKPAFVDPKYEDGTRQKSAAGSFNPAVAINQEKRAVDNKGRKIIPELQIEHLKTHRNGNQMTTTGWVTNPSTQRVRIDDIILLKQKVVLHRELGPGEGHEVQFYHGVVAEHDHEHKAHLLYRLVENGDCFRADYRIEYSLEHDGKYMIEELHPEHPVHDV